MARLVQQLQAADYAVSVRDLLSDVATAAAVAERQRVVPEDMSPEPTPENRETAVSEEDPADASDAAAASQPLTPAVFTLLQVLLLTVLYLPAAVGLVMLVTLGHLDQVAAGLGFVGFLAAGCVVAAVALLMPLAGLGWVMLLRVVLGRRWHAVAPGVYPKWSWMHLRVWWLGRRQQLVLRPLATSLRWPLVLAGVLRCLGARVGSNLQAAADAEFAGPLCLLEIGSGVAIHTGACVSTSRWVGQELHLGRVRLGDRCLLGMRSGVVAGATVGRESTLSPLSSLDGCLPDGEALEGAGGELRSRVGRLKRPQQVWPPRPASWQGELKSVAFQVVLELILVVLPAAMVAWATAGGPLRSSVADVPRGSPLQPGALLGWLAVYAVVTTWLSVLVTSLVGCVFVRLTRTEPGMLVLGSLAATLQFSRQRKMNQIQRIWSWSITGQYLRALAGLRLERIGASECDVMFNLVPEMVSTGAEVFWSHGCYTNVLSHDDQYLYLGQAEMLGDVLVGNNAVVEPGQFPQRMLVGVSTPVSETRFRRQMRSRCGPPLTVAGNPPLEFAQSEAVQQPAAEALPGCGLFLVRFVLNDLLRVSLLPITEVLVYTLLVIGMMSAGSSAWVAAVVALVATEAILVTLAVGAKAVLVGGRWGQDDATPFWSLRHFFYFFAQDCFFVWCRRPLEAVAGTLLANPLLRRMGCRIGKRTMLSSPLQAFDFNAVSLGDDCLVSGILQLHSFEGMMLQVKRFQLGDGGVINVGATVMGGAALAAGTTVEPHSLVMKDMVLAGGRYRGSPAARETPLRKSREDADG